MNLDYTHGLIDVNKSDPSPFQVRQYFDQHKLKELGESIQREGLIEPIVVRRKGSRYEIIAGERRFRAVRDFTEMKTIPAHIVTATDRETRKIAAAENMQRENLSAIETIEAIVEIVDAELFEDQHYAAMGEKPADRVRALLGKLDTVRRSRERGSDISGHSKTLSNRFIGQVEEIFQNLPKPIEWLSFLNNDLPLLMDICEEVRTVSIQQGLNRSQTRALERLKEISSEAFQRVIDPVRESSNPVMGSDSIDVAPIALRDLSAREITDIAERAAHKEGLAELNRRRVGPASSQETVIHTMGRLGIPLERVAARLKINRKTARKYADHPRLIRRIQESLKQGLACHEAAEAHGCPEPLVWSIALEGKGDGERFQSLGWGLRTWDHWYFNDIDQHFGDDWPGRIPAQLIAHILYYFSDQNDLVFDPMAGGGVVADTCLAFNRKCRSFDMDDRPDTRPEIEPYFWDISNVQWPIQGKAKPDLILFDPPYFKKQSGKYDPDGISGLSKKEYLEFLETFFGLALFNAKQGTHMAFINADWRDFQGIAAREEDPGRSIFLFDYVDLLRRSGWEITHLIDCPLSTQRFLPHMVRWMQKNRTLGVVRRSLVIGRKLL